MSLSSEIFSRNDFQKSLIFLKNRKNGKLRIFILPHPRSVYRAVKVAAYLTVAFIVQSGQEILVNVDVSSLYCIVLTLSPEASIRIIWMLHRLEITHKDRSDYYLPTVVNGQGIVQSPIEVIEVVQIMKTLNIV